MRDWEEEQESAASFFRSLGMDARTNESVAGARGVHSVDVVARKASAGIEQIWLVECKRRHRRVEKLHVAALAEIVKDVGADRGILLSEGGFQAGAIRMARSTNITLSSLSDLKENSQDERAELGLRDIRQRVTNMRQRVVALQGPVYYDEGVIYSHPWGVDGVDIVDTWKLASRVSFVKNAVTDAFEERWPVQFYGKDYLRVWSRRQLVPILDEVLVQLEGDVAKHEVMARSARSRDDASREPQEPYGR